MSLRLSLSLFSLTALVACGGGRAEWPYAVDRSAAVTIVTELPEAEGRLRNATTDYGTFFIANACLQVRTEAGVYTPVLPRGASFDPKAREIVVGGRRFQLGRRYSLPFAAEIGTGEAADAIRLPGGCSRRLLSMGAPA